MPTLISVPALTKLISTQKLHILDATALLPGDSFNVQAQFEHVHLPGSLYFDIDVFSDPESPQPHAVPTQARFERLFGALGINASDTVVFYDQGNVASACRGWWLARLFGHQKAYVLDGGLPVWLKQNGQTESGNLIQNIASTIYQGRPTYAYLKGLGDMLDCVQRGSHTIIDARSTDRFYGRVPEPRPGLASGHMPNAINIPFKKLLAENNQFLPPYALKNIFIEAGVTLNKPCITTCGSGMTASVLTMGLCLAGFSNNSLYDGSWAEWGATPNAPVEKEGSAQ